MKALVPVLIAMSLVLAVIGCMRTPPGLARGKELYRTCVPCHGDHGGGNASLAAPAIAGLPEWYLQAQLVKFKGGIRGAHPEDMEGARMRPMARSLYRPGDLESVAKYVAQLTRVRQPNTLAGGDVAAGEGLYAVCATCHGEDAGGIQDMNAPTLHGQADWYLYHQLEKFKSGMRGAHPEDVTGQQMAAMSTMLEDSTAMRNVIAYIRTLAK
ncbi:MAG: c-type cytochrome [Candidatus Eisenbacteria bacterium]|uniref:C-type cytochrome n=1 Tax=Eiseniibacteriota bacterium TaxID=2212470 RepID=A0A849SDC8_UNCEI|nr:c-type cytochrome [Candidatus Eisenbacteria bacterium]